MNTLRSRLLHGELVTGTMLSEIYTPNIVRILKCAQFDCLFVDCEHGCFDFAQLANLAVTGRGFGMGIIVRVPSIQREFITKVLDMGVDGLLLPQTDTPELARRAVEYSRYAPQGKRGVALTRSHSGYQVSDPAEYAREANENLILLAQIESRQGADNARSILEVDGIDGLLIGPNDLAADCGVFGQTFSESVRSRAEAVLELAREQGRPCGIAGSNVKQLAYWKARGMTLFCLGSEIHMLLAAAGECRRKFLEACARA